MNESGMTSTHRDTQITNTNHDIIWIDDFIRKVKPYIYVREKDRVLILIPNQVYRLNASGLTMLKFLLSGRSIEEFLQAVGDSTVKRQDIHHFFCDLRAAVTGCLREGEPRRAVGYYEYSDNVNSYPVLSEIAVTYRCNLTCEFCYVGRKQTSELGTGDMKKIIYRVFHEAEIPSVSFTGGEPLLREDICALVGYAAGIGMWTNIITNGTLITAPLLDGLKEAGLSSTQVSLEGATARVHDRITGVAGSFEKTIASISLLRKKKIPVHTNTTISRHNFQCIEDIPRLIRSLGLPRFSMNLLIPCGAASCRRELWITYSEIGEKILRIKQRAEDLGVKFLWYSPLPVCAFNPIAHGLGNKSCAALTGLLSVDPGGNVLPCSSWPMPIASLLKTCFMDIWQSPALCYFQHADYAPSECQGCQHFKVCKGACPLYWEAQGTGELHGKRENIRCSR